VVSSYWPLVENARNKQPLSLTLVCEVQKIESSSGDVETSSEEDPVPTSSEIVTLWEQTRAGVCIAKNNFLLLLSSVSVVLVCVCIFNYDLSSVVSVILIK